MGIKDLVIKHSRSGPRYTSYPTAPQWSEKVGAEQYLKSLGNPESAQTPLALYVHIPFCESLCYYCGCNILITKEHGRGVGYVKALLAELESAARAMGSKRKITQISWGGGTPTFLTVDEITMLHQGTRKLFELAPGAEVSIEVDPRVTSDEQLECLAKLGFNRISLGVQDFDLEVQTAINRIQSAELTERMLKTSRRLGFSGINFDLIYGLPLQTVAKFEQTMTNVMRIRPDRIALYNYARLPAMIPHQKILEKFPMPSAEERVDLFNLAYEKLVAAGYQAIGMDHFALETDELYRAIGNRTLYRNFMGYTVKRGTEMIGIGSSSIGELSTGYFQNIKEVKEYESRVTSGKFATLRGCTLTEDDRRRKWTIQTLMCDFYLSYDEYEAKFKEPFLSAFSEEIKQLDPFLNDGILTKTDRSISVTPLGRLFIRNVAMIFDAYLKAPQKVTYSKTV